MKREMKVEGGGEQSLEVGVFIVEDVVVCTGDVEVVCMICEKSMYRGICKGRVVVIIKVVVVFKVVIVCKVVVVGVMSRVVEVVVVVVGIVEDKVYVAGGDIDGKVGNKGKQNGGLGCEEGFG